MVARLKLKEIDGRAPPGVNAAALRRKAARKGGWPLKVLVPDRGATSSNCGDLLKLLPPRLLRKAGRSTRVTPLGKVKAQKMLQWTIRSQTPAASRGTE